MLWHLVLQLALHRYRLQSKNVQYLHMLARSWQRRTAGPTSSWNTKTQTATSPALCHPVPGTAVTSNTMLAKHMSQSPLFLCDCALP